MKRSGGPRESEHQVDVLMLADHACTLRSLIVRRRPGEKKSAAAGKGFKQASFSSGCPCGARLGEKEISEAQ